MRVVPVLLPAEGRADRGLADALGISRARAMALLGDGRVRLGPGGRKLRKGEQLPAGTLLQVTLAGDFVAGLKAVSPVPEAQAPLVVLHESAACLVLDKPAGVACHPLRAGETGTLANALLARYPECGSAGDSPREGGLCHRLDRETSGVILAARQRPAYRKLRVQFEQRTVRKTYLALARGAPTAERGAIDLPLTGRGTPRVWRRASDGRALPALTRYAVRATAGGFSLLEVEIETGMRYQIRAHLAAIGLPLAGDGVYAGGAAPAGLTRHLLHAWKLGFQDPATDGPAEVSAPLPSDAARVLATLGLTLNP